MASQEKIHASAEQIAAARRLLRMTQTDLAQASGITDRTITAFESGKSVPHESTAEALQTALENRGIVFSNGDKPTVQLDHSKAIIPT